MRHIADKRTGEWLRRYPQAIEQAEHFRAGRDTEPYGTLWADWCGLPMAAAYAIITDGADVSLAPAIMAGRLDDLPRLTCALLWRQAKAVYRFDLTMVDELDADDDLDMEIPVEVLKQLPYYCVYLEHPFEIAANKTALGAFAWMECDHRYPDIVELRLLFLMGNDQIVSVPLQLRGNKFKDALSLIQPNELTSASVIIDAARLAVGMLLYICSDQADVATRADAPPPRRSPQAPFRANPNAPTVWEAGMRIGAAIRTHRAGAVGNAIREGTHSSPRAHVRRAHWHSFWSGPLKGDRSLKLRWLPPIPVNYDVKDELPTTIRDVSKRSPK